jgi:hypothetical protein
MLAQLDSNRIRSNGVDAAPSRWLPSPNAHPPASAPPAAPPPTPPVPPPASAPVLDLLDEIIEIIHVGCQILVRGHRHGLCRCRREQGRPQARTQADGCGAAKNALQCVTAIDCIHGLAPFVVSSLTAKPLNPNQLVSSVTRFRTTQKTSPTRSPPRARATNWRFPPSRARGAGGRDRGRRLQPEPCSFHRAHRARSSARLRPTR